MARHEDILRLLIAAVVAVMVHAFIVPLAGYGLYAREQPRNHRKEKPTPEEVVLPDPEPIPPPATPLELVEPAAAPEPAQPEEPKLAPIEEPKPQEPPKEEEVKLGKPDALERFTVAWISYDQFEELIARQARTLQPAVQQEVDPALRAPTPPDPTPPAPQPAQAKAGQPAPPAAPAPDARRPEIAEKSPELPTLAPGPLAGPAVTDPGPDNANGRSNRPEPTTLAKAQQPAVTPSPAPDGKPVSQPRVDTEITTPGRPTRQDATLPPDLLNDEPSNHPLVTAVAQSDRLDDAVRRQADSTQTLNAPAGPFVEAMSTTPDEGDPMQRPEATTNLAEQDQPAEKKAPRTDELAENQPATAPPAVPDSEPKTPAPPVQTPRPAPGAVSESEISNQQAPTTSANPTAAPRDEKDSPPTIVEFNPKDPRIGRVIVGKGLRVDPVRPNLPLVARYTVPDNMLVRLTFDADGLVTRVLVLKSSGYAEIDSPMVVALYKWKAFGPQLEKAPVPATFNIILRDGD